MEAMKQYTSSTAIQIDSGDRPKSAGRETGKLTPPTRASSSKPMPITVTSELLIAVRYMRKPVSNATGMRPKEGTTASGSSMNVRAAKMENTAMTRMSASQMNRENSKRARGEISGRAISGTDCPSERTLTKRLEKSATAPMRMLPTSSHSSDGAQPQ